MRVAAKEPIDPALKFCIKDCHHERKGPQTFFSLGVVSRRIRGCFSFIPLHCLSAGSMR